MRVPVLQNINSDPSAPVRMQTNSVHTDGHVYTATYAGKPTHTGIFIQSYTHGDTHTHSSQSRDRCDCSDNRNRTTSGLTVRYVDVSRECSPLYPKHIALSTHTGQRRNANVWCMCARTGVGAVLYQFSFNSQPGQSVHIPHTHTSPRSCESDRQRRDPFSL